MLDVMVLWDEEPGNSPAIARVRSVASPETAESPSRDVVTLYGQPTPESLALALAAAVEARKQGLHSTREFAVSESHGAVGDTAYRDRSTGELIKRDLNIPLTVLRETAQDLLAEGGQAIRRLLAGLLMTDWPEGTRRALSFQLAGAASGAGAPQRTSDTLAALREADGADGADFDDAA
jgi:hypothetical protein